MIIQQSIFVIILKASTSIVHPVVRAFTEKLCRPTNRFLQVALYFLLLILIVDWCFELFMRLYQGVWSPDGENLVGVSSSEIGMSINTVPTTRGLLGLMARSDGLVG